MFINWQQLIISALLTKVVWRESFFEHLCEEWSSSEEQGEEQTRQATNPTKSLTDKHALHCLGHWVKMK